MQQQMAELYERDRSVVTRHIHNVFREGELDPESTSPDFSPQHRIRPHLVVRMLSVINKLYKHKEAAL